MQPLDNPLAQNDAFASADPFAPSTNANDPFLNQSPGTLSPTPIYPGKIQKSSLSKRDKFAATSRKKFRSTADDDDEESAFDKIMYGLVAMFVAVVWFVGGLFFDIIFFYPPILFCLGLAGVVYGLIKSASK